MTEVTRADYDHVMIPCYKPADILLVRGKKCRLYDSEGRSYLDFGGGIAVNCLGNAPKIVRKALKHQAARLIHVSNVFANDATIGLAKRITKLTGFDRVFFTNSGAESNECALKLARRTGFELGGEEKSEIISFTHSFHGRTFFTVSVGGQDKYSSGFGPRPGAITHLPFNDIAAFEKQISDKTCAVIFEPVQGEGGVLPVDPKFARRVRELCDKHHALLVMDEVQSGCARSGTFFAFEQVGVRPDIVTTAKGLAGGVPIGCVLTTNEVAAHFHPGTHGSTFGGNALACAVGSAVLDKISTPEFLEKVRERGAFMRAELEKLNDDLHVFNEVRGMGLLIGCELIPALQPKLGEIQKKALEAGLIILTAGGTTIRLCPPLIIKKSEIREGVALLKAVLALFAHEAEAEEKAKAAVKLAKGEAKPAVKAEVKTEAKTEAKPAVKPAAPAAKKPAPRRPAAKRPVKAPASPTAPAAKPEAPKGEVKDPAKVAPKTAPKAAAPKAPASKPAAHPATKAEVKATAKDPTAPTASAAKTEAPQGEVKDPAKAAPKTAAPKAAEPKAAPAVKPVAPAPVAEAKPAETPKAAAPAVKPVEAPKA